MKLLICDDSVVYRSAIKKALEESGKFTEFYLAKNGKEAVEIFKDNDVDCMTLDVEMPVMNGIETLKAIRDLDKDVPIVMFSAVTEKGAEKTLDALRFGANDFVRKIESSCDVSKNYEVIRNELIPKFESILNKKSSQKINEFETKITDLSSFSPDLLLMTSSTGGPDALMTILPKLDLKGRSLLLVQHMPPVFTTQLARRLDELCDFKVVEAQDKMEVTPDTCFLAPGDFHMTVKSMDNKLFIALNQEERVCFVRPAADVLFNSVRELPRHFKLICTVLTGMGYDGANGVKGLKESSSHEVKVLIQDQKSSTVWGMPGEVYRNGHADVVGDLNNLAKIFNSFKK